MNNVTLIGRLTKEPELRFNPNGKAVCNITLAIDKNLARDKKKELEAKGQPTADFIRCIVWNKQAENTATYTSKGKLVAVNGSISTSSYQSNTGATIYTTDVSVNNIEFLEWNDSGNKHSQTEDFIPYNEDDDDIPF